MKDQPYRTGLPPESGALIEAFPRPASRFPVQLRQLIDRYPDPNTDGAFYLVAAAVAVEDTWGFVDGTRASSDPEVGPRTLCYALESLVRWQTHERLSLSADFHRRFTDMSAAIRQYCRLSPSDPPPEPDPPLECLLMEVGWLLDALVIEIAPDFCPGCR